MLIFFWDVMRRYQDPEPLGFAHKPMQSRLVLLELSYTTKMVVDVMVACVLDGKCDDFEWCLRCQRIGTGFGNAKLAESPVIQGQEGATKALRGKKRLQASSFPLVYLPTRKMFSQISRESSNAIVVEYDAEQDPTKKKDQCEHREQDSNLRPPDPRESIRFLGKRA